MTKPIVSAALMMLYEEGRFLLTDPITDWVPELADKQVIVRDEYGTRRVPPARPVTIRDVLAHTAGVDPNRADLSESEQQLLGRAATLEETILQRAPLPLDFHPGDEGVTAFHRLCGNSVEKGGRAAGISARREISGWMNGTHYIVPADKVIASPRIHPRRARANHRV